jgi:hypothetical protein
MEQGRDAYNDQVWINTNAIMFQVRVLMTLPHADTVEFLPQRTELASGLVGFGNGTGKGCLQRSSLDQYQRHNVSSKGPHATSTCQHYFWLGLRTLNSTEVALDDDECVEEVVAR